MGRARWVLIGVLAACGRDKAPPAPAVGSGSGSAAVVAPVRLYTDAELAAFSATLLGRLADNARRVCVRPVIGGTATTGANTRELIAMFEPGSEIAACIDRMRAFATGDLGERIADGAPALREVERTCGDQVERAIAQASRFAQGCSPYQVGVHVADDVFRVLRLAWLISVHARRLATAGDPGAALLAIARGFAVFQDLSRGHVNLVGFQLATAAEEPLLEHAWAITRGAVPAPALDEIAAALDTLLAAEPTFAEALEGERDSIELFYGLAPIQPAGWTPPGGWDDTFGPPHAKPPLRYTRDPHDEAAVMFALAEAQATQHLRACPPGTPLATCQRALAQLAELRTQRASALTEDPTELVDELARLAPAAPDAAVRDALRTRIRTKVIDTLVAAESPVLHTYAARRGGTLARLAALRLHVEVLRFVAKTRRCPTVIELDAPPFRAIVAPPALGDQLTVERRGDTIRVTPPAWVTTTYEPWDITCPR